MGNLTPLTLMKQKMPLYLELGFTGKVTLEITYTAKVD